MVLRCTDCGFEFDEKLGKCPNCGKEIGDKSIQNSNPIQNYDPNDPKNIAKTKRDNFFFELNKIVYYSFWWVLLIIFLFLGIGYDGIVPGKFLPKIRMPSFWEILAVLICALFVFISKTYNRKK
jgi:DNA-directed RNA polymerase subunit RPC12/RpoP